MTARQKRPKPIRLTEQRARSLYQAAQRGTDEWEAEIREDWETSDLDHMRILQHLDELRALALDGMAVIAARYLDGEALTEPNPTLFD